MVDSSLEQVVSRLEVHILEVGLRSLEEELHNLMVLHIRAGESRLMDSLGEDVDKVDS